MFNVFPDLCFALIFSKFCDIQCLHLSLSVIISLRKLIFELATYKARTVPGNFGFHEGIFVSRCCSLAPRTELSQFIEDYVNKKSIHFEGHEIPSSN